MTKSTGPAARISQQLTHTNYDFPYMDAALKELVKLETLINAKEKCSLAPSILDSLLQTLYQAKEALKTGDLSPQQFISLAQSIEATKKEIDNRQKEVYSATSRFGKVLDKVGILQKLLQTQCVDWIFSNDVPQRFPTPLPAYSNLFSSQESFAALERTIALHFLRTGQFEVTETFLDVSVLWSAFLQAYHTSRNLA